MSYMPNIDLCPHCDDQWYDHDGKPCRVEARGRRRAFTPPGPDEDEVAAIASITETIKARA